MYAISPSTSTSCCPSVCRPLPKPRAGTASVTSTSPGGRSGSGPGQLLSYLPYPAQLLTLGMGPVGDAQSCRVSVYAIRNHPVEDAVARRQLVTGQKPHYAWVPVVELSKAGGNN